MFIVLEFKSVIICADIIGSVSGTDENTRHCEVRLPDNRIYSVEVNVKDIHH